MAKRKALTKKIRFEVFKRDSFTCQYCGESAPDVILQVDHIVPVKEGGDNSILNLVTSCIDCNQGKGATRLSDGTAVKKAKKQADKLQQQLEQIQMMADWQKGLVEATDAQVDIIEEQFLRGTGRSLTDNGKATVRKHLRKFGLSEILEAIEIARDQYFKSGTGGIGFTGVGEAFSKLGGICWNRKHRDND